MKIAPWVWLACSLFVPLWPLQAGGAPAAPPTESAHAVGAHPIVEPGYVRLSFAQAVLRGLAFSADADRARHLAGRALGTRRRVMAQAMPSAYAQGTMLELDHKRVSQAGLIAGQEQISGNVTVALPIVSLRAWGDVAQAQQATHVAEQQWRAQQRDAAMQVGYAYLNVITQTLLVDVIDRAVETNQAHYDFARARFLGGVGNRLDQLRADQELQNSKVQQQQAQVRRLAARESLGVLVGASGPADVADDMVLPNVASIDAALADVATHRHDLKLKIMQLALSQKIYRNRWLDYLPTLIATASVFAQRPATASNPEHGWQTLLLLSVPLYDGGARYGAHKEAFEDNVMQANGLDAAMRQARSEVRTAFASVTHAEAALDAAQKSAERAREALALATRAYHTGTTGNLEVIDSERVSRDADTAAVAAQDTVRKARLDLVAAAGLFPSQTL